MVAHSCVGLRSWSKDERSLRIKGNEESLIKDHACIAISHADLRIWSLPVDQLSGSHIAGIEINFCRKPNSCTNANDEGRKHERCCDVEKTSALPRPVPGIPRRSWRTSSALPWWCIVVERPLLLGGILPASTVHEVRLWASFAFKTAAVWL